VANVFPQYLAVIELVHDMGLQAYDLAVAVVRANETRLVFSSNWQVRPGAKAMRNGDAMRTMSACRVSNNGRAYAFDAWAVVSS